MMSNNMDTYKVEAITALFVSSFHISPTFIAKAPGRVNLMGEHTDYNNGYVLPIAINCHTFVAISARNDHQVRVVAGDIGNEKDRFSLDTPIVPCDDKPWANYIRGMVAFLMQEDITICGLNIAVMGDIPRGIGLSSSAALENAVGLAIVSLIGKPDFNRTRLAQIGQKTEHQFVGCQCGIMDQLISAKAEQGSALLLDCKDLKTESIAIPDELAVLIVHSGVQRSLASTVYNLRRQECDLASTHYRVNSLRDLNEDVLFAQKYDLEEHIYRRAKHVVTENKRTLALADALKNKKFEKIQALMTASHLSMKEDFEITVPAVDALFNMLSQAIGHNGGARMTGGGGGGAVIALLPKGLAPDVTAYVRDNYKLENGQPPMILLETANQGACIL